MAVKANQKTLLDEISVYFQDRGKADFTEPAELAHGPANMTRLRRFAVGLLKSRGVKNISQKMRQMSPIPSSLDYDESAARQGQRSKT